MSVILGLLKYDASRNYLRRDQDVSISTVVYVLIEEGQGTWQKKVSKKWKRGEDNMLMSAILDCGKLTHEETFFNTNNMYPLQRLVDEVPSIE